MLSLFRRIRRKILRKDSNESGTDSTSNKKAISPISRYFLYIIGEIALVVIGILIALQINNWKEYNIERSTENQYLRDLSNDLKVDSTRYIWNLRNVSIQQSKVASVISILENKLTNISCDSIQHLIEKSIFIGGFNASSNTFEEMKSSGRLKLITDQSLKLELLDYYNAVINIKALQRDNNNRFIDNIYSFTVEHWPIKAMFRINRNEENLIDCAKTERSLNRIQNDEQVSEQMINQFAFLEVIMTLNYNAYEENIKRCQILIEKINAILSENEEVN